MDWAPVRHPDSGGRVLFITMRLLSSYFFWFTQLFLKNYIMYRCKHVLKMVYYEAHSNCSRPCRWVLTATAQLSSLEVISCLSKARDTLQSTGCSLAVDHLKAWRSTVPLRNTVFF